jgi:D-cysteine desulfhydrase
MTAEARAPSTQDAGGRFARLPRVPLVLGPTPLHPAPRLSAELGVPVLLKRDDLAGVGLGGNKLRGLEYIIADARGQGCDCLVTGAGPQSNWTMLAALACLRHQIEPHVVCYGRSPVDSGAADEGNMRLHRWLGVDVRFTGDPDRASVDAGIEAVAAELRASGRRPYTVPRGGATPLGALGYGEYRAGGPAGGARRAAIGAVARERVVRHAGRPGGRRGPDRRTLRGHGGHGQQAGG